MKKIILVATMCAAISAKSQNTLPTNGNVGIGTMNPSAKLDVNGRAIIDKTLMVKDSVCFQGCLTVEKKAVFEKNTVVKGNMLKIEHDAKVEHNIRINNNTRIDNVLRVDGTTKLNGNVVMPNITELNASESKDFTFLVKNEDNEIKTLTRGGIGNAIYAEKEIDCFGITSVPNPVWNHGENKIYTNICNLVNVGIGTTNPSYKLDVKGQGRFSGNVGIGILPNNEVQVNAKTFKKVGYCVDHNFNGNYGYAIKSIVNNNTTKGLAIYNKIYNKDIFTVYGSGKMEISNANGKILQLESDGLLLARKIRVDENNWADYVFDSKYILTPLFDLELFIKTNGHLPNIPSANEVKTNGIDLSDMQRLQMEKIEELTLYTIEQEKKIAELQKQLDAINELLKRK